MASPAIFSGSSLISWHKCQTQKSGNRKDPPQQYQTIPTMIQHHLRKKIKNKRKNFFYCMRKAKATTNKISWLTSAEADPGGGSRQKIREINETHHHTCTKKKIQNKKNP